MTERARCVSEGETIRILHVDDDACFLEAAKPILEMQGAFQVETALSVEEAVEKMKKEEYDAVVSDYQMPGKDGLQFLKELRQKGNNIPFIIFTGKGREEVAIKALNLGADHYENKNGNPEMVYSELSHDITNAVRTRRAEQELRIRREELQVILDSMPAKIWYKDRDNRLVRVNKAFAEYMGVSKENLEGKPLCDLFPPDIAQKCWEEDKEVITTGQPKIDILDRHESAQGVRWFSTCKVPCRDSNGNIIGTISFSVDITENKKMEVRLKKSEKKYRQLVQNVHEGIWAIDKDAYTTFVNPRMAEMLGYNMEEMKGRHVFSFMDERGVEIAKCFLERRKQGIKEQHEFEFLGKDGKRIYALMETASITDDNGNYIGALASVMDITERKRVEEALRQSKENFESLAENAFDGLLVATQGGIHVYANKRAAEITGYTIAELLRTTVKELVHPDESEKILERYRRRIEGRTVPNPCETVIIAKDGRSVPIELAGARAIWEHNPADMVFFRDIIERKKIEESLRESEEKFRSLFESANDPMALFDATGRVLDVNKKAAEAFGGSKGELVGMHFTRACLGIMPPTQISKVVKEFVAGLANKKPNLDVTIKNKKGQTILLECSASLLKLDDKSTGLLLVARDITERKRAEEELARSEAKYRSLVDQSLQGMVVAQGVPPHVVFVNPTMIQMSGYTSEELASIPMERLIHPDDRPAFFSRLKDRLEGKSATSPNEYRAIRKDGKVVWIDVFSTCVEYNGQPAVQATFINITDRKKTLEKAQILNEKLGVVGGLTRHDVRNKLSAVVGNTYLAEKTLPNDHKALAYLKEIESACGQTTRILDFAAAYESLGVEGLTLMDVSKAVEEAVSLISESKGVNVVNNCQGLTVMADSALSQLFFNLIENSLKHGKNVSQIKIHCEEEKDRLKLFYEDNGIGIPKSNKPKLFHWGFTTGKGLGYGLPLIKSMMGIYGWTIEEEGEPGKGARFVMTIPNTQFTIRARNSAR